MRSARIKKKYNGFSFVEAILGVTLTLIVALAAIALIKKTVTSLASTSSQNTSQRAIQMIVSRLKAMDFNTVFDLDSSLSNYGINGTVNGAAVYPYKADFDAIVALLRASKLDGFRVRVTSMRRDAGTNGMVAVQGTCPGADASDSSIVCTDQNLDGDYYDTYYVDNANGHVLTAEMWNTGLKWVQVDIIKNGAVVETEKGIFLNNGGLSGENRGASGATLALLVSTPSQNGALYRYLTSPQITAHDLAIINSYPPSRFFRADSGSALLISGITAANATVNLSIGGATTSLSADSSGNFSGTVPTLTSALVIGQNTIAAQAARGTDRSAMVYVPVILDVTPPSFSGQTPTTTNIRSLSPLVGVSLFDTEATTTSMSGVFSRVITFKVDNVVRTCNYNSATGLVKWVDNLGLPPSMTDGTSHTVYVEGGDAAGYKTSITWTFSVQLAADATQPNITCVTNTSSLLQATLDDAESGVKPATVQLTVTRSGTPTVVIAANSTDIADHYAPTSTGGTLSYIPSPSLSSGDSYTITADHWATSNPQTVTCNVP